LKEQHNYKVQISMSPAYNYWPPDYDKI